MARPEYGSQTWRSTNRASIRTTRAALAIQRRAHPLAASGPLWVDGKHNIVARSLKPMYLTRDGGNVRIDQHLLDTLITPFVTFEQ